MWARIVKKAKRISGLEPPILFGNPEQYGDLVADEYVEHLRAVVGGWAPEGNIRAIECAVRQMPPGGAMVEVGSFLGLSTNIIAYAAHKYRQAHPFFTSDPWVFAGRDKPKAGYFSTGTPEYRDWVMANFRTSAQLFSANFVPHAIETFSTDFFKRWAEQATVTDVFGRTTRLGGPISFAYLDGDHSYEVAREDFLHVDQFLLVGGYVLFDDSADNSSYDGLRRLMREVSSNPAYTLVLKSPNYCFRKKSPGA
jgi:hypothetical protein